MSNQQLVDFIHEQLESVSKNLLVFNNKEQVLLVLSFIDIFL